MKVVVAPDSFKGSLDAEPAARAIAAGWSSVRPHDDVRVIPQADGGEGTLEALKAAIPHAEFQSAGLVSGPDGRPHEGIWLRLPDGIGVVELAQSSGLPLMSAPDALGATTRGLGEVIAAAIAGGARSLVICLGGSASTDGGAGALRALGVRLLDGSGRPIGEGGGQLRDLRAIDLSGLVPAPLGGVVLLSDVTAPLLGPRGAAAIFGPQKGASADDVAQLEAGLERLHDVLHGDAERQGAGAAGGAAYGFASVWSAETVPGARYVAEVSGLASAIGGADVVLTGEGRFDETSMSGKVVGNILSLASDPRIAVGIIAGQLAGDAATLASRRVWTWALAHAAPSLDAAQSEAGYWLEAAGAAAARDLLLFLRAARNTTSPSSTMDRPIIPDAGSTVPPV